MQTYLLFNVIALIVQLSRQNTYLDPEISKIAIKNEICDKKYIRVMNLALFYERKHYVNEQTKSRDVPRPACPMTLSTVRRLPVA